MSETVGVPDGAGEDAAPDLRGQVQAVRSRSMQCPACGSGSVVCHENTRRHVHLCNGCGRKDIYRGNDG